MKFYDRGEWWLGLGVVIIALALIIWGVVYSVSTAHDHHEQHLRRIEACTHADPAAVALCVKEA